MPIFRGSREVQFLRQHGCRFHELYLIARHTLPPMLLDGFWGTRRKCEQSQMRCPLDSRRGCPIATLCYFVLMHELEFRLPASGAISALINPENNEPVDKNWTRNRVLSRRVATVAMGPLADYSPRMGTLPFVSQAGKRRINPSRAARLDMPQVAKIAHKTSNSAIVPCCGVFRKPRRFWECIGRRWKARPETKRDTGVQGR